MKSINLTLKALMSASFLLFSVLVSGQQQSPAATFEPQVGQQGKDVVWVPTPQELVNKMLEIAHVGPSDFVIDLGSGDGRTVISAAKLGARALGVEFNPDMVALSRSNARKEGMNHLAEFVEGDLFETDLSKATVITMFLLPEINLRLRPKLLELKPGTRIVSNTLTMGDWQEDVEATTDENWNSWNQAHLWIVPAKVEGTWKTGNGELKLTQKYQMLEGSYISGGKESRIREGRMKGDIISLTINDRIYTGRVQGNRIEGNIADSSGNSLREWTATR
ncbi:MAG TPA: class I SAM-dependent methyltransferase [Bacteroidales bacterium]|nr:class I SAM-dependent methyltransferase [Bacteroidales bacterium]